MEEQLRELTRLVLRLPEVDALLQRVGLQHAVARPEPTAALEMFVKAGWSLVWQHSKLYFCAQSWRKQSFSTH